MGVLTDIVIAGRDDAQKVGEADVPSHEFPGIDAKGINQVHMGTLYAILTRSDYDPRFMTTHESFVYSASQDGPWVQLIPDDMVARLAKTSDAEIPLIADEWGKTEEFDPEYSRWTKEDIVTFLRQLTSLSRKAQGENKSVFMWSCL